MTAPPPPTYTFLPWVQRGMGRSIAAADEPAARLTARVTLPVHLRVEGVDDLPAVSVRLYGPGDVTGLDPAQIVRCDPAPGTSGFEAGYMAQVQFARAELPWLFTPAAPGTAKTRLRPWLVLVTVARGEGVRLAANRGGPLPVLELDDPAGELPDLAQSWAWAHAQILGLPAGARPADVLVSDPVRACSRLLCPRHLQPGTAYLACLVPAFLAGVKAGLGQPVTPADEATLEPAWKWPRPNDAGANAATPVPLRLPVYHSWEFATGPAGSFETLVRRLHPSPMDRALARPPLLDLSTPGGGLPEFPGMVVGMQSALHVPDPDAPSGPDEPPPWPDADAFQTALEGLLTGSPPDELAPPVYGQLQAGVAALPPTGGQPSWLGELNLDPRLRVAAAAGTRVVQERQEQLMARAWEQAGALSDDNAVLRRAQLARELVGVVMQRHLEPLAAPELLAVTRPAHAHIELAGATVDARLRKSPVPVAVASGAMRRLASPQGLIARRAAPAELTPPPIDVFAAVDRVAQPPAAAAPAGMVMAVSGVAARRTETVQKQITGAAPSADTPAGQEHVERVPFTLAENGIELVLTASFAYGSALFPPVVAIDTGGCPTDQNWTDEHPRLVDGQGIVGFGDDGVWTAVSNGDGTFQPARFGLDGFGVNHGWRVDQHLRVLADITGDGRTDIVGFADDGPWTALSNGDGTFQPPRLVLDGFNVSHGWRADRHPRLLADLTGDGRADIVGFGDDGVSTALSNGDGTVQPGRFVFDGFGVKHGWRADRHPRLLADITGDGRADIVGFHDDGPWTALSNGDGTFQPARPVLDEFGVEADGWRVDRHPRLLADLTGDGRADIVGFGDDHVATALSNGDGTFQPARPVLGQLCFNHGWRVDRHPRLLADLSGDGRADIVGFGDDGVWTALSNGDGTFQPARRVLSDFGGGWRVDRHPRLLADLTGDGRADIVGFGDDGVWTALSNGDGTFAPATFVHRDFGPTSNSNIHEIYRLAPGGSAGPAGEPTYQTVVTVINPDPSQERESPPPTPTVPAQDLPAGNHVLVVACKKPPSQEDGQNSVAASLTWRAPTGDTPPPMSAEALRVELLHRLAPEVTVLRRTRARVDAPEATWVRPDPLAQLATGPRFDEPMYEALQRVAPGLFLPGVETVEADGVALLETTPQVIEAYMVGLNHELSRELLWREYPASLAGTAFRQFWDIRGLPGDRDALFDIPPIAEWDAPLGKHLRGGADQLVLLVRGELLRRYPTTTIYAAPATGPEKLDTTTRLAPMFRGALAPDIVIVGFELSEKTALGKDQHPPGPGWFFVFEQYPGEPRFGFDEVAATEHPRTPDALAWAHVPLTASGHADVDRPLLSVGDDLQSLWGRDAASTAWLTFQKPFRVAMHASQLLPKEEEEESA